MLLYTNHHFLNYVLAKSVSVRARARCASVHIDAVREPVLIAWPA
jgi:hypothetical protein